MTGLDAPGHAHQTQCHPGRGSRRPLQASHQLHPFATGQLESARPSSWKADKGTRAEEGGTRPWASPVGPLHAMSSVADCETNPALKSQIASPSSQHCHPERTDRKPRRRGLRRTRHLPATSNVPMSGSSQSPRDDRSPNKPVEKDDPEEKGHQGSQVLHRSSRYGKCT